VLDKNLLGLNFVRNIYLLYKKLRPAEGVLLLWHMERWLRANQADAPLFLWIHLFNPHLPYTAHKEYLLPLPSNPGLKKLVENSRLTQIRELPLSSKDKNFIHQSYLGEVLYTDSLVGRLLKILKEKHLYDNSIIIFTADHGEEFWDHNGFEHGHSFFQELIKVPLFIKMPGNDQAGLRIPNLVSTVQIFPTFLKFAEIPQSPELKASYPVFTNFPDLIRVINQPETALELIVSEYPLYFNFKGAILDQNTNKLIIDTKGNKLFFNLEQDPLGDKSFSRIRDSRKIVRAD